MCLCVARASHSHKTSAEISSSAPHFLHNGLSLSPIMWRCLLKVLCPSPKNDAVLLLQALLERWVSATEPSLSTSNGVSLDSPQARGTFLSFLAS
jgi:hypothetical protein